MAVIRGILAVIAGYLAIAVWVFATLTIAWLVLGQSFAFEEGTTRTSMGWCITLRREPPAAEACARARRVLIPGTETKEAPAPAGWRRGVGADRVPCLT